MYEEISECISVSNELFKRFVDSHSRIQQFQECDYVMIRVRLEQYLLRAVKKLHVRSAGPFKILKRIGPNTYFIDLLSDWRIISTFNVFDLVACQELTSIFSDPCEFSLVLESELEHECLVVIFPK